jgi:hypothetical protein
MNASEYRVFDARFAMTPNQAARLLDELGTDEGRARLQHDLERVLREEYGIEIHEAEGEQLPVPTSEQIQEIKRMIQGPGGGGGNGGPQFGWMCGWFAIVAYCSAGGAASPPES